MAPHLLSRKAKNVNEHVMPSETLLIAVLPILTVLGIFEVLIPEFLQIDENIISHFRKS